MNLYDLAEEYAQEVIHSVEFQKLLNVKKEIKETLSKKIIAFKTAEAKYEEAKSYGEYHPNLIEYREKLMLAKKSLYEEPAVIEYKRLETLIQDKLNKDINELKESVSNKFKATIF